MTVQVLAVATLGIFIAVNVRVEVPGAVSTTRPRFVAFLLAELAVHTDQDGCPCRRHDEYATKWLREVVSDQVDQIKWSKLKSGEL